MCRQTTGSATSSSGAPASPGRKPRKSSDVSQAQASKDSFRTLQELSQAFACRRSGAEDEDAAPYKDQQHKQKLKATQQRRGSPADAPPAPLGSCFGTIRSVFRQKGFAFISDDDGVGDVFLHFSDLRCGISDALREQSENGLLAVGMRVRYFREQGQTSKARVASGGRARKATIVEEKTEEDGEEKDMGATAEEEQEMGATAEEVSALPIYSRGELLAALVAFRTVQDSAGEGNFLGFKTAHSPAKRDSDESESSPAPAEGKLSVRDCYTLWGPVGTTPLRGPLLQQPPPGLEGLGPAAFGLGPAGGDVNIIGVGVGGLRAEAPCFEPSSLGQLTAATGEAAVLPDAAGDGQLRAEASCFEPAPAWVDEFDAWGDDLEVFEKYWAANAWTFMHPFEAEECCASAADQAPEDISTASGSASDEGDGTRELADIGLEVAACA